MVPPFCGPPRFARRLCAPPLHLCPHSAHCGLHWQKSGAWGTFRGCESAFARPQPPCWPSLPRVGFGRCWRAVGLLPSLGTLPHHWSCGLSGVPAGHEWRAPPRDDQQLAPRSFLTSVFWIHFLAGELLRSLALYFVWARQCWGSPSSPGATALEVWILFYICFTCLFSLFHRLHPTRQLLDLISNATMARLGFANMGVSACFGSPLLSTNFFLFLSLFFFSSFLSFLLLNLLLLFFFVDLRSVAGLWAELQCADSPHGPWDPHDPDIDLHLCGVAVDIIEPRGGDPPQQVRGAAVVRRVSAGDLCGLYRVQHRRRVLVWMMN